MSVTAGKRRAPVDPAPAGVSGISDEARFAPALYVVAGIFFFTPIIDATANVWPFAPGAETWRYGAFGAAANYLVSVLFGAVLAGWTAVRCRHARTLRTIAVASALMALLLSAIALEFLLDVLQLRPVVPAADRAGFAIGAAKAELKYVTTIVGFIVLAVVAWRGSRTRAQRDRSAGATAPLIGGAGAAPK